MLQTYEWNIPEFLHGMAQVAMIVRQSYVTSVTSQNNEFSIQKHLSQTVPTKMSTISICAIQLNNNVIINAGKETNIFFSIHTHTPKNMQQSLCHKKENKPECENISRLRMKQTNQIMPHTEQ